MQRVGFIIFDKFNIILHMKSLGLFLVYISVTILSVQQTVAQTSWQQMTSGTSSRLWSAAFANDSTVFAVGVDGLMMKSINKGTSWSVVNHGLTTKNLYSIHFATNLVGFAGGLSATVLKTTDGGATWFDISANLPAIITSYAQYSTQEINDFYFLNANTGFAVGYNGIILKTNDGATSWNFSGSLGAGTYRSVWFVDPATGFIASHGKKIKKTVNGGENWADWVSEETTFNHFFEIRFFNATTGVAIGDGGVIFRTVDAGESWTRATVTPAASGQLWGLEIVSENVGYASGQSGQIYVTNDAGVSWSKQETNLPTAIYRGMAHSKDSVVIAVGDGGLIMRLSGSPTEPEVETGEHWVHGIESFGVNLSGGEFGGVYPGTIGTHYGYPTYKDLDYFKSKGLTLIRFPFRWERVQYQLNGPLNPLDLGKMKEFVQAAEDRNLPVILDMHNFARRSFDGGSTQTVIGAGSALTKEHLADVWKKLAMEFKSYKNIWGYDIMNEPYSMPTPSTWFDIAQAAINSIREVDTITHIVISGDRFSSSLHWVQYSDNLRSLVDPYDKLIYQAHMYFDKNQSGSYGSYVNGVFVPSTYDAEGATPQTGVNWVKPFVDWLKKYNKKGLMGEYGIPDDDSRWNLVLENMLIYLRDNGVPGTYWSAGPRWGAYRLAVHPSNNYTVDRPQMAVLEKYTRVKGDETALYEIKQNATIKINQGHISVYLQSGGSFNVAVYDAIGKLMFRKKELLNETQLPELTGSNLYIVFIESREGREVHKIVL